MSGELEACVIFEYSFTGMHFAPAREPDTYRDDCSVRLTHEGVRKTLSSKVRDDVVFIAYEDIERVVLSFNKVSPGYSCSLSSQGNEGGVIEVHSYNYSSGINHDPLECNAEFSEFVNILHSKMIEKEGVRFLYEDKGVVVRQNVAGLSLFLFFLPVMVLLLFFVTGSPLITAILGVVATPAAFSIAEKFMPEGKEYSPSCIPSQFLPPPEGKA